ncbi:MAG: hypothetical protein M0Q13_12955 [Methanothrix sp.]|jgi:hypothetical protein|nr:hypothetical protein [Methanothrix sp.]
MNIPKKIRVEGIDFSVLILSNEQMNSLKKDDESEKGVLCGITDFEETKILINNAYCESMREQTFWHELIHIIDSRMNPLTEEQIDNLARRLNAIFKDNPKLFKD